MVTRDSSGRGLDAVSALESRMATRRAWHRGKASESTRRSIRGVSEVSQNPRTSQKEGNPKMGLPAGRPIESRKGDDESSTRSHVLVSAPREHRVVHHVERYEGLQTPIRPERRKEADGWKGVQEG